MLYQLLLSALIFFVLVTTNAQQNIYIKNASFEDTPHHAKLPKGWLQCSFERETAPDIHPIKKGTSIGVTQQARHGKTHVGLVTRDNQTWESVIQELSNPLERSQCYEFRLSLARSKNYESYSRLYQIEASYTKPTRLRIWGMQGYCKDTDTELLAVSPVVEHIDWREYTFTFAPQSTYNYLKIEVYYDNGKAYNGNLLIDHASKIEPILCENQEVRNVRSNAKLQQGLLFHSTKISTANSEKVKEYQGIGFHMSANSTVEETTLSLVSLFEQAEINAEHAVLLTAIVPSKKDVKICRKIIKKFMPALSNHFLEYQVNYKIDYSSDLAISTSH